MSIRGERRSQGRRAGVKTESKEDRTGEEQEKSIIKKG